MLSKLTRAQKILSFSTSKHSVVHKFHHPTNPTSQPPNPHKSKTSLPLSTEMSSYTIASLPYISREKLADLVRAKHQGLAVIDVRDSDYVGGHILDGINVPVSSHDYRMPELVRTLKDKDTVVFHCALSQQRGPSSALRYLREKERLEGSGGDGQKVYVLEGGFVKWQEIYGEDKALTEDYAKDIWEFGY